MESLSPYMKDTTLTNGEFTHVTLGKDKNKWYVTREFQDHYIKAAEKGLKLCIAEKPDRYVPLIVDIDLKLLDGVENLYTIEEVKTLILSFHTIIKKYVNHKPGGVQSSPLTNKQLHCAFLEKNGYVMDSYFKNGFHLHFPYLFLAKDDANQILKLVEETINFKHKQTKYLDEVASKCWLLYGSSKHENLEPYLLTEFYDHNLGSIKHKYSFADIVKLLSISSVNKNIYIYTLKQDSFQIPCGKDDDEEDDEDPRLADLDYVQNIVNCLCDWRADDYNEWWKVGVSLFNVDVECLDIWKRFSSRSSKYDEATCEAQWLQYGSKNRPLHYTSLGTLIYMAKLDNPKEFSKIKSASKYIPRTDTEVVKEFLKVSESIYIYGNLGWFVYNGIIWEELEDPGWVLRLEFEKFSKTFKHLKCEEQIKLTNKLENYAPQSNLIKLLGNYVSVKRLDTKFDSNRFLISFLNGTYDLKSCTFRKGEPSDFLSKTLNVGYDDTLTLNSPSVLNILIFLRKIFPDPNLLNYFLLQISEVFYGGNRDKVIMIWTGKGNNGKSVLQSLFEKIFGRLAIKVPVTAVTSDTKAGGCFPELARLEGGVRWAVMDEFDENIPLNVGKLKLLSGNDSLYARDCFEKGKHLKEIKPFFNLILICNSIPKVKKGDRAFFKRLKVIPFESEFRDDITEDQPENLKFKEDSNIVSKMEDQPEFLEAFVWYLIEMYKVKSKSGFKISIPAKVNEATNKYKAQCDTMASFINECFVVDQDSTIRVVDYYFNFKEWYTQEHNSNKGLLTKSEFCQLFLDTLNGDEESGRVVGYKLKESE